jgi:hypothetical protein
MAHTAEFMAAARDGASPDFVACFVQPDPPFPRSGSDTLKYGDLFAAIFHVNQRR